MVIQHLQKIILLLPVTLYSRKHAYLLYKSQDDAAAALDAASASPLELDGQSLIVCRYKEPPAHIPDG